MNLLQLCDETPATVKPETSVAQAIQLMLERRVGAVAVVDAERRVAGIFTERDVLRKVALSGRDPNTIKVSELMTTPVELGTLETATCRWWMPTAACWACSPSATCCRHGLTTSRSSSIRSSNT